MAGYSFRLSENVSDGHLCSFKIGYFKCVFFSLSPLASSTFLKEGVHSSKQSKHCDRETPDSTTHIFFFLLKSQSIPHFTSPPSCSPHLPESSCTSCWRAAGKYLCGRECQNVLVELLYRTETMHLKLTSCFFGCFQKEPFLPGHSTRRFPNYTSLQEIPKVVGNYDVKDVF